LLVVGSAKFSPLGIFGGKILVTRANLGSGRGLGLVFRVIIPADFFFLFDIGACR
jgi:hypothetical protein